MRRDPPRTARSQRLAALLVLCAGGCLPDSPDFRLGTTTQEIIGGVATPGGQAGYMAALIDDYGHGLTSLSCGGTFLAPDLVVTAAHCSFDLGDRGDATNQVIYEPLDPSSVKVARRPAALSELGASDLLRVKKIYVHPDFTYTAAVVNDIAVWRLAEPSRGPSLRVASPALMHHLDRNGGTARAYGYGVTNLELDTISDFLQQVDVPLVDQASCRDTYYEAFGGEMSGQRPDEIITDSMLCAGAAGGRDPCSGDSGGPLVTRAFGAEHLLGIVSWGKDCALPGFPGVYTRAANYRPWLSACARDNCEAKTEANLGCLPGYADCDGDPANGCELNLRSTSHCGSCAAAAVCKVGEACVYERDGGNDTAQCRTAQPIEPRIDCVYDLEDGARVASFGYSNLNQGTIYVRRGPDNRFTGVPNYKETISRFPGLEEFQPGRYKNAPIALLGAGVATWTLRGPDGIARTVRVDESTPHCATHPSEWGGEQAAAFERAARSHRWRAVSR